MPINEWKVKKDSVKILCFSGIFYITKNIQGGQPLSYLIFKRLKLGMRTLWDEHMALSMLKKWIDDGKWRGTTHFRKYNTSLYEYLYRTMGLNTAFEKIDLRYSNFKKHKGKKQKEKDIEKVIQELDTLIKEDQWKGIRDLQLNHSFLYR